MKGVWSYNVLNAVTLFNHSNFHIHYLFLMCQSFAEVENVNLDSAERVQSPEQASSPEKQADASDDQKFVNTSYPPMNERQKKLFELQLKMVCVHFLSVE